MVFNLKLERLISAFLFVVCSCLGYSQTTIWSVNFETGYADNDVSAQDNNSPTGADWTKAGTTSNWWRVESDNVLAGSLSMNGRNLDNTVSWTSESIQIAGYSNVSISIDLKERNCDNGGSDLIETFYDIGAGNVEFGDGNGDGDFNSVTNTITGLTGNTLTIVVTMNNNGGGERSIFDNIVVTGTPLGKDGPGGVGKTDGSDELELWLSAQENCYTDAGSTAATNGSSVQQWNDLSGNGFNAIETTGSEKPTYQSNQVNGFAALDFDGSTERITSTGLTTAAQATVFAVFSRDGSGGGANDGVIHAASSGNAYSTSGSSKTIGMWVQTSDNVVWGRGVQSNGSSRSLTKVTALATSQFHIVAQDYDGSDITQYANGATAGSISYNGTLQSWTDFGIGRQGNESLNGQIAEIIAYRKHLSTAQRRIIENYLAAKYGLSLSANDIYDGDASGFYYEVAGIGQENDGKHEDAQGTGIVRVHSPNGLSNGEYLIWGHDNGELNSWGITDLPAGIQARLERDWTASEVGEVGTVSISFDLSGVAGSITASDLRLLVDDNGTYASGSTSLSGATHLGGNVYQWTGVDIDDNDHFTIGSIDKNQTPLPVELVEFKATPDVDENVVYLFWVTASETDNDYFTIERTKDFKGFEEVIQVTGQGTSNERREYNEVDMNPKEGVSYYRLSQTDFDGNTVYFNMEKVLFEMSQSDKALDIQLYPNPNNGQNMFIRIPNGHHEELNVLVNDFLGKEFLVDFTVINQGEYSVVAIEMNQKLARGSYLVSIGARDNIQTYKLIVQ